MTTEGIYLNYQVHKPQQKIPPEKPEGNKQLKTNDL
jgi:hypothetical protein